MKFLGINLTNICMTWTLKLENIAEGVQRRPKKLRRHDNH